MIMIKLKNRLITLALSLVILAAAPVTAASKTDWTRSVAFYLWLADTDLDAKQDGESVGGGTIKFDDLLDKTEFGYAILAEVGPTDGRWSVFTDLAYFELADRMDLDGINIKIDVEATVLDIAGVYSPAATEGNFGIYAGIRYLSIDTGIRISLPDPDGGQEKISLDDSYTDALIGARFRKKLTDKWSLKVRGDVSTGDTEYTYQAEGLFGYRIGKKEKMQLLFGYRYRESEIEEGGLTQEIATSGPIVAFRYDF
jgi:hypothetical protein